MNDLDWAAILPFAGFLGGAIFFLIIPMVRILIQDLRGKKRATKIVEKIEPAKPRGVSEIDL
jgi:hypothetical protein